MASISNEKLSKAVEAQNMFWSRIIGCFAEATGTQMEAENAQLELISPVEIDSSGEKRFLSICFAFADQPDRQQAILIKEKFADLYSAIEKDENSLDPESILTERRSQLESFIQGVCLAVGEVRGEMMAATGLSLQIGHFLPPSNFQVHQQILRSSVNINCSGRSVEVAWLFDPMTLDLIFQDEEEKTEPTFQPAPATNPGASGFGPSDNSLDLLMDIPLEISVELGRMRMLVKDVLEMGAGSIVEIDKAAGEPVDVLVNGRPVARGEVVVIEDNFGVRITEILNPKERIARLNDAA